MVGIDFINIIVRQLEKYLIQKNNFMLSGRTYDLILFVPPSEFTAAPKFSLLISAKSLDDGNIKINTEDIFRFLVDNIALDEYLYISRINILHSNDPFVKNINFVFPIRNKIFEIDNFHIGNVIIKNAYLVKSIILDKLIQGHAMVLTLSDGKDIKAGIKRIDKNFDVIFYTEKGLDEIFSQNMNDEQKVRAKDLEALDEDILIREKYIEKVAFDKILSVS